MNILQYLKLKKSQRETLHLNLGLKQYGLCPNDWKLIPETNNTYKIINAREPEFIFKGETKIKQGRIIWKKIVLKSI